MDDHDHDHDPPSPAENHDMDVDADMDTSDAETCGLSFTSTSTSSTHDLFSTSSTTRSHCADQTTNTSMPAPPSFSSPSSISPSSSSSSSATFMAPPAAPTTPIPALTEVTGRFAPLLSLFRRRRQQHLQQGTATGGRDSTLGASETWPPQGLFPSGGGQGPQPTENAQDEVEVWLRRELQAIVRSKSARWGIDFASDPQERVASVIMAEEGLTEYAELERPPPPRDSHLDSNISDTSTASLSAQAALLQVSPHPPSRSPASAASSCSTTTTPSAGSNDHSSVYDVKRTGSKRPPH